MRNFIGKTPGLLLAMILGCLLAGCNEGDQTLTADSSAESTSHNIALSDAEIENIVRRSYQYVALYNVNNKAAMDPANPARTDGWNRLKAQTQLLDHTSEFIARPNNDTLYINATLDLTREAVILEAPAFDSKYVSLMATGYDHYVNIPLSSRDNDFAKPTRVLFYSQRTPAYNGETVAGIDKIVEMDGDFISAVYRVMPHISEPERLARIRESMEQVKVVTLSEYQTGKKLADTSPVAFPPFGRTDADVFEHNLLEVMQFIFNHTTFDPNNELDNELLEAYRPLGVIPGRTFDAARVAIIDGEKFRCISETVKAQALANMADPRYIAETFLNVFLPKGQIDLDTLVFQSVVGPIGQPAREAVYPPVLTTDLEPMNALHDYVVRMPKESLPPARAFWSITLYDLENGFFIPNDRKKYSVGGNGGMKRDEQDGITVHIAAEQPAGVPAENWLPIARGDYGLNFVMRVYSPDLARLKDWKAPRVEMVQ
jgi:hypothetical protein